MEENDLQVFCKALKHVLDVGERMEADDGYIAEYLHCDCPTGISCREDRVQFNKQQRSRHETVNTLFKNFGCMKKKFRHSIEKHGNCFMCVAILTQISNDEGPGLFPINYDDSLNDLDHGLL